MKGKSPSLPLAGVIPPSRYLLVAAADDDRRRRRASGGTGVLATIASYLGRRPLYMLTYVLLIVFFAFFYTAIFNPTETADLGGVAANFPGMRPGGSGPRSSSTRVLMRITVIGAAYLVVIPEMLSCRASVFGGTP
jgi:preprotein translocase subunit SecY